MDIRKENELYRQMDLLQMKEISTYRQQKNGTRIFQLPIKKYGQYIEVGSFQSGYVRRMNGGYTPYQLNKCENYDHFYPAYEWKDLGNGEHTQVKTGKYNKHVCRRRLLIPNEVDRLEYLIAFCLKNYYINQANMIENGKFIPKWKHEYDMENRKRYYEDKAKELKLKTSDAVLQEYLDSADKVRELQEENRELKEEIRDKGALDNLSVTVNGHKYKVI